MPHDTHYVIQPPVTGRSDEPIRYACQEKPCVDNEVMLAWDQIDTHAVRFHNSFGISVEGPYR